MRQCLQYPVADDVAIFVVDPLEAVAVDQQQTQPGRHALRPPLLQVQMQAATVVEPGQFVNADQLAGLAELVGRRMQVVQGCFQILVATAQLPHQALFAGHHAADGPPQEIRHQSRVAVHQMLEFAVVQRVQGGVGGSDRIGGPRMVADQQAELAEELQRPHMLGGKVLAEIQLDRTLFDHVHRGAQVAAPEQCLARSQLPGLAAFAEQDEFGERQGRAHGDIGSVVRAIGKCSTGCRHGGLIAVHRRTPASLSSAGRARYCAGSP
jgi:hypothetical protein